MARVETSDGVVRNLVDQNPGDNRQRIAVSPDAFGANVGAAQERGGQVLQRLGDQAFDQGEHFARVQVDDQATKSFADVNKHLETYRTLEGQARLSARPQVEKSIEDSFRVYREQLKLPFQQAEYDRKVAGFKNGYLSAQMSSLSEQADKSYKAHVAKSGFEQAINLGAVGAGDPKTVAAAREMARGYAVNMLEAEGNAEDDTLYQGAIQMADRTLYKSVVQSVGATNPQLAIEIADQQKEALGAEYHTLVAGLRSRSYQQEGDAIADQAIAGAGQALANPEAPRPSGLKHAIYDQEGGPETNPTQIQETTWEQWKKDGLVHEGERFGDPAAMRQVSDRAIAKYEQDFGGDPERVAVAWFSGPGNVAPAGAKQPYLENRKDRNGKTVDSYVSDIRGRVGGSRGGIYQAKATAYDLAADLYKDKPPEVRDAALRQIDRRINAAQVASMETEKASTLAVQQAVRGYGDLIRQGQPGQPWQKDGRLTEAQVRDLDDYQLKRLKPELEGSPAQPGAGFAKAFQDVQTGAITNDQQLLPLVRSGQLSPWGYDYVAARLKKYNEPGQEITKRIESNAFESAKRQITMRISDDFSPPSDRLQKWDNAIIAGTLAVEQARARNVPDAKIFDPENKEGFWAAMKPFMPTQNEKTAAMVEGDLNAARKATTRQPFDWSTVKTYDDLKQAYKDHPEITREQAVQFAASRGWKPTKGAPTVPVDTKPAGGGPAESPRFLRKDTETGVYDQGFADYLNKEPGVGKERRKLSYALDYFAQNDPDPDRKELAGILVDKIRKAGDDKFEFIPQANLVDGVGGLTKKQNGRIAVGLHPDEVNGETAMHESVHAVVMQFMDHFGAKQMPAEWSEAEKSGAKGLYDVFEKAKAIKIPADAPVWLKEGLGDSHEFLARTMTDPRFQQWMKEQDLTPEKSLWDKFVDGAKKLVLGDVKADEKKHTLLEDALQAGKGVLRSLE